MTTRQGYSTGEAWKALLPEREWLASAARSLAVAMRDRKRGAMSMGLLAGASVVFPTSSPFAMAMSGCLAAYSALADRKWPMPRPSRAFDGVGSRKDGILYVGKEMDTGKEVWLTDDECRQHFLMLGTTGSGKTESLLATANAMAWSSGCVLVDGKGDVSVFAKLYAIARRMSHEDDILVVNMLGRNATGETTRSSPTR